MTVPAAVGTVGIWQGARAKRADATNTATRRAGRQPSSRPTRTSTPGSASRSAPAMLTDIELLAHGEEAERLRGHRRQLIPGLPIERSAAGSGPGPRGTLEGSARLRFDAGANLDASAGAKVSGGATLADAVSAGGYGKPRRLGARGGSAACRQHGVPDLEGRGDLAPLRHDPRVLARVRSRVRDRRGGRGVRRAPRARDTGRDEPVQRAQLLARARLDPPRPRQPALAQGVREELAAGRPALPPQRAARPRDRRVRHRAGRQAGRRPAIPTRCSTTRARSSARSSRTTPSARARRCSRETPGAMARREAAAKAQLASTREIIDREKSVTAKLLAQARRTAAAKPASAAAGGVQMAAVDPPGGGGKADDTPVEQLERRQDALADADSKRQHARDGVEGPARAGRRPRRPDAQQGPRRPRRRRPERRHARRQGQQRRRRPGAAH